MSRSRSTHRHPAPADTSSVTATAAPSPVCASPLRVREPGELVAAVPTLLGFHPRSSLVLVAMGGTSGRRLGLVVRDDLPDQFDEQTWSAVVERSVAGLMRDHPTGAALVVVAAGTIDRAGAGPPWARFAAAVADRITGVGVEMHAMVWAAGTGAGARWACYGPCGCGGPVPEQSAGALAASAAAEGTVVFADRSDLERLVAPVDPARLRRRERLLNQLVDAAAGPDVGPDIGLDASDPALTDPVAGVALVEAALADAAADRLALDDRRIVSLATALTIPAVRDAAIGAAAAHGSSGTRVAAAEQLWAALCRETPDPEAAEPATLLAVSAMLRGDGALANVALDRALSAWPGHRFSRLLRAVSALGMRPEEFRAAVLADGGAQR